MVFASWIIHDNRGCIPDSTVSAEGILRSVVRIEMGGGVEAAMMCGGLHPRPSSRPKNLTAGFRSLSEEVMFGGW